MPTTQELHRAWQQKAGEQSEFVKSHTTPEGSYDFSIVELKSFNDRNDELSQLHGNWEAQYKIDGAAKSLNDELAKSRQVANGLPYSQGSEEREAAQRLSVKSLGEQFMESAQYQAMKSVEPNQLTPTWMVDLPNVSMKAIDTSAGVAPYGTQIPGIVRFAIRRPVVRDILPVSETQDRNLSYIEEVALVLNGGPVAEGGVKPESTFQDVRRMFNLETIAHFFKVTNQALDFIPGLQDQLNDRGALGIALGEENQILNGTGTSPGLQGFLTKTGVQVQPVGGDDQFTAFMKGMTRVQSDPGFANVTAGIINPLDWLQIATLKDTTGRFIYGDPSAIQDAPRMWGKPLVPTTAIPQGTLLMGDFQMYSRFWVRGGIRILVGYVNDDLIKNQQTIVIEEYAALEIDRATAFCKIVGLALT